MKNKLRARDNKNRNQIKEILCVKYKEFKVFFLYLKIQQIIIRFTHIKYFLIILL